MLSRNQLFFLLCISGSYTLASDLYVIFWEKWSVQYHGLSQTVSRGLFSLPLLFLKLQMYLDTYTQSLAVFHYFFPEMHTRKWKLLLIHTKKQTKEKEKTGKRVSSRFASTVIGKKRHCLATATGNLRIKLFAISVCHFFLTQV